VLHACCHNPTGYDITPEQWDQVIAAVKARKLVPFLDMAYQGFGYGIAEDGAVIGKFVASGQNFFVSTSFSKSFSLYGERVGALSVLCQDKEEAARVLSQLKVVIRTNYSNPPIHGGQVVAMVLNTPELRALWEKELGDMRLRIKQMRIALVEKLKSAGVKQDMSFITQQIGMFSYSADEGPDGACATSSASTVPTLPHVRGRPEQQKHRLGVPVDREGHLAGGLRPKAHQRARAHSAWLPQTAERIEMDAAWKQC
jgi:aspartate/tyrosine/aromatic aminotransferase